MNILTPEQRAESERKYRDSIQKQFAELATFRDVVVTAIRWRKQFHTEAGRSEDYGILFIINSIYVKNPKNWKEKLADIEREVLKYPTLDQQYAYLATIQLPFQMEYFRIRLASNPELLQECLQGCVEDMKLSQRFLSEGSVRNKAPPFSGHYWRGEPKEPRWWYFTHPMMSIYREAFPELADDSHLRRTKLMAQKYELIVQAQQKFPVWCAPNVYERKYKEPLDMLLTMVKQEIQIGDDTLGGTHQQKADADTKLEALARREQIVFGTLPMPLTDAELCKLLRDPQYAEPSRAHYTVLQKCIEDTVKEYAGKST